MNYDDIQILEAQQFACEFYNIPRQVFIEKAARRYPSVEVDTRSFLCAVQAYDEIQQDLKEVA